MDYRGGGAAQALVTAMFVVVLLEVCQQHCVVRSNSSAPLMGLSALIRFRSGSVWLHAATVPESARVGLYRSF